jgi:uroporphyrinogen III methyltransferase/synthase
MRKSSKTEAASGVPFSGQRIMVTRPESQADPLAEQLRALGAEVVLQPAICIVDPPDWNPVDQALTRLNTFQWLVFSSANGVRYFFERWQRVESQFGDIGGKKRSTADFHRQFPTLKLAAIGPGTADELARCQVHADLIPQAFQAEALAESLCREARGHRFLLARASRGREVLAEQLTAAGADVEQIVVYSSLDVQTADPVVAEMLVSGRIDWITVTSSAIARSLVRLFGEALHRSKLACISPLTSNTLRELGYEPAAEATEYTMSGLVSAMAKQIQNPL